MSATQKAKMASANERYREGRFSSAEQSYLELHALDPENTGVLARLGEIALWKNQTEEAEHYLKAALRHTSWLEKQWPLSVQLKTSLAMTYYRRDRFRQAAQFFKEAAGPASFAPFDQLKAMGTQLTLFDGHSPYLIEGPETTSIPFSMTDPLPVIQVSVNGSEPLPFFIDTGGAELILDTELANKVGAIRAGTFKGEGGGTKGTGGLGKIDTMTIGDLIVHHVPVQIMDTQPFASVFDGLPVKGVIGTRLLMHFLATIDYKNACLILRRKTSTAQVAAQSAKEIPFWLIQTHYMVTQGTLNGNEPMLFFVDTGLAGTGFSAPASMLQKAGIVVDWSNAEAGIMAFGKSETADFTANRVTLGSGSSEVMMHNVPGVAFKKPFEVFEYRLGFWIGGLVSHQFFRSYALTLDFVRMKLILSD